jgi:hypothetical protein
LFNLKDKQCSAVYNGAMNFNPHLGNSFPNCQQLYEVVSHEIKSKMGRDCSALQ